jgi:hypothetical protein
VAAAPGAAFGRCFGMDIQDSIDLRRPCLVRQVREVDGVEAQGAGAGVDHAFDGAALQAVLLRSRRHPELRQHMRARGEDRDPGQQHVAELLAAVHWMTVGPGRAGVHVQAGPVDPVILGQQLRQLGGLVDHAGALEETLDFLEGDDVRTLHLAGDAGEIVAAVFTEAVLDVVADEAHRREFPPVWPHGRRNTALAASPSAL